MEKELTRLQKYISECGIMSRRAAEKYIESGRITINDEPAVLGDKIDPENDIVKIDGKIIKQEKNHRYVYVMLNKPIGYITTMSDQFDRKCVADLLSDIDERVYPVGRLDYATEGLLICTNDGSLANKLMHPSGHLPKTYILKTKDEVDSDKLKRLNEPFVIDDYTTVPAECSIISEKSDQTVLKIVLHEGRNRQIRKMCEIVDIKIKSLKRVSIGDINLGNLPSGKWKYLTKNQINYLKKYK